MESVETLKEALTGSAEIIARSEAHVMKTYRRYPVALVRGAGCRVFDAEGRSYLDFVGGIAVAVVGHCHPRVVAAIQEQAARLIHTSNLFYTEPQAALAERLAALSGLERVFFANSGTEAVEAALKLARRYAASVRREEGRRKIVSAFNSFHGRTLGALAATGQEKYHRGFEPLPAGFEYVPYNDPAALEAAVDEKTAAVILEPVQGEGGVIPATPEYLQAARRVTQARGALLILDEVQTGLGRTGWMFAHERAGIRPDILTLAKGLGGGMPIGAMLATEEAARGFEPGSHASTFGGNPLACRAALAVLDVIAEERLVEAARARGERLLAMLRELVRCHGLKEARGVGLMLGIDLGRPVAPQVVAAAREQGLLINATGPETLRLLPPLVVGDEEVDAAVAALDRALAAVMGTKG
ncbi:MAG TPA: acetylornithine transaminase [Firmicutes bacterium]|nr:acetylornithine transaminase [Bacillota bacterium]